jgi:hypothetical protein
MFGNVLAIARLVRVWARYLDRIRVNAIIGFMFSDPTIKEGTRDDFGAAIEVDSANTRLAAHSVSRLTLKRYLQGCRDDEIFFKLSSTPECHALRGHRTFGS